ncbi:MAG: NAD(+)/NADH kinase [Actinomycetota bacterium]
MTSPSPTIAILVNPRAGKDIRRLVSESTPTSDSSKVGIVRRALAAALETGVDKILLMPDRNGLGRRAAEGFGARVEFIDIPSNGTRSDTVDSARAARDMGAAVVISLGGDGTCRDVASGWPDAPLIAISTGTNNVYPSTIDGTSAGAAAALLATEQVAIADVAKRSKCISVRIQDDGRTVDDIALVDLAIVQGDFVGSRAINDANSISMIIAAISTPMSTGLSSVAGRIHPVGRWEPGGVVVDLGDGMSHLRVPLAPGTFSTLNFRSARLLDDGEGVTVRGRCILAFDGERDRVVSASGTVSVQIVFAGPRLIDVAATLEYAARCGAFVVTKEDARSRAIPSANSRTACAEKVSSCDVH